LVVSVVGLAAAVVGAAAGLGALGLYEMDAISANTSANLGALSILGSLVAIPLGVIGWRWRERRRENSVLGQAAGLIGCTTFLFWLVAVFYALGRDTP
jgi:hypothetical protein